MPRLIHHASTDVNSFTMGAVTSVFLVLLYVVDSSVHVGGVMQ